MGDIDTQRLVIAQVIVTRFMAEDGEICDEADAQGPDGGPIDLAEALGLLRLAEHKLLTEAEEEDQ